MGEQVWRAGRCGPVYHPTSDGGDGDDDETVGAGALEKDWVGELIPARVRGAHADADAAAGGGYKGGKRPIESWVEGKTENSSQD